MKKLMLGILWQILGFLGSISMWLYAVHYRWDSMGIIQTMCENKLIVPFLFSIILFVAGLLLCISEIKNNE